MQSGRYNLGHISGEVEFPSLSYAAEATPEGEAVRECETFSKSDGPIAHLFERATATVHM
jgi:hypothetical protein